MTPFPRSLACLAGRVLPPGVVLSRFDRTSSTDCDSTPRLAHPGRPSDDHARAIVREPLARSTRRAAPRVSHETGARSRPTDRASETFFLSPLLAALARPRLSLSLARTLVELGRTSGPGLSDKGRTTPPRIYENSHADPPPPPPLRQLITTLRVSSTRSSVTMCQCFKWRKRSRYRNTTTPPEREVPRLRTSVAPSHTLRADIDTLRCCPLVTANREISDRRSRVLDRVPGQRFPDGRRVRLYRSRTADSRL